MAKFAAFLRGVNVGGVNLKMAEVATALTDAGFCNVRTILASSWSRRAVPRKCARRPKPRYANDSATTRGR